MANEHPNFGDDVPQFSGKINDQFVEWVTDVRLWEAEHKDHTEPRLGPHLYRRGLLRQPKQIIKTSLGQGDQAHFAVDNNTETLRKMATGTQEKRMVIRRRWTTTSLCDPRLHQS